jgi:hypothetical protein
MEIFTQEWRFVINLRIEETGSSLVVMTQKRQQVSYKQGGAAKQFKKKQNELKKWQRKMLHLEQIPTAGDKEGLIKAIEDEKTGKTRRLQA